MIPQRSSGILAHITSLPSRYGIGDIGPASYDFISFLAEANQSYWQFLPITPTKFHFDHSPYMSHSAFAGNSLLISPDLLLADGLISKKTLSDIPEFSPYTTEFIKVSAYKKSILEEAWINFKERKQKAYNQFTEQSPWLNDYACFMTAKEIFGDVAWSKWPEGIASRDNEELTSFNNKHKERILYYCFEQYIFHLQWLKLKEKAQEKQILLFGDLPIYVSYDSVDVWSNQEIFLLDPKSRMPTHVAGVPPDYFSKTGQRWGNPLYDWQTTSPIIRDRLLTWWVDRLKHLFTQADLARIDHFRGFESYWAIPEDEETAVAGEWLKGPGIDFFQEMREKLGPLNIIAEDLGIITKEVTQLREKLQFPGMKVLQFAFDGNINNDFLPFNFKDPECVVYTGTHDNDTTLGWYLSNQISDTTRDTIKALANKSISEESPPHLNLIYLAQASISKLCIFPLQDVLGFGNDCKMNSPGVPTGNWRWRCAERFLTSELAFSLRESTARFGRGRSDTP